MSGHTPGPWARGMQAGEEIILAPSLPPRTRVICHVFWPDDSLVQGANADFIVRACNSHDELLKALKTIAQLGGNLPDDRLTDKTGANDAARRGLMYVAARSIAVAAIAKAEMDG